MPPRKSTTRDLFPPPSSSSATSKANTLNSSSGIPITPSLAASLHTPNPAKRAKTGSHASTTPMHPPPLSSAPSRQAAALVSGGGIASSSKVTLDSIPPAGMPESLTPGYVRSVGGLEGLDEEERGKLIHELVGFYPRNLLDNITEEARKAVLEIAVHVEGYMQQLASGKGSEYDREVDIGIYAFETLLSNHVDKAFDKFTAWALRNTFDIPNDVEVVMPWCQGLDFDRGAYVAALPEGEETVLKDLEKARSKVEQMRYLSQQLERAEKILDRRLDIARQRKDEVGFIGETLTAANRPTLAKTKTHLSALHETLHPMAAVPHTTTPSVPSAANSGITGAGAGAGQKAWELGRQSYLSWAVGKALAVSAYTHTQSTDGALPGTSEGHAPGPGAGVGAGTGAEGGLDGVEQGLKAVGTQEALEAASRAL